MKGRYSSEHPPPDLSDFHLRDLLDQKDGFLLHKIILVFDNDTFSLPKYP